MQIYQDFQEPQKAKILVEANDGSESVVVHLAILEAGSFLLIRKKAAPDPNK